MSRPCGKASCCSSTSITDEPTYGSGYLDSMGFWENPCFICARHFEEYLDEAWPHIDQIIEPMEKVRCPECKKMVIKDSLFGGVCGDCYDNEIYEMFGQY